MAITLDARTDRILDSVLKALNADAARLAEAPLSAQVVGELRADTTAATTTQVQVSNGHLWPATGQVTIVDGANTETLTYVQVLPVGRTGNKRPTYNGTGSPPQALLRLTPGTTTANNHTAPVPVHVPAAYGPNVSRALDSGLLGVHDLAALFRALKEDLTPAVLTVTADDVAEAIQVDGSTAGAMNTGASTAYTTEINEAVGTTDVLWTPAVDVADNDYFAVGYAEPWGALRIVNGQQGVGGTMTWEYWNGTAWTTLSVTESAAGCSDLTADGTVSWTIPTDWATTTSTLMTASGDQETDQLYWVRMRVATVYNTGTLPLGTQAFIEMGINGVMDVGAFQADTHVGDTVTMVTGGAAAEVGTITSNTTDVLYVAGSEFSDIIDVGDTYQVNVVNYDDYLETLEAKMPAVYNSAGARTTAAGDASPTPSALATTMVNLCIKVIDQYGGTVPTNNATTGQLAREECRTTRVAAAVGATDTQITVEDASLLLGYTNILIDGNAATITRNNARKGGQGPNTIDIAAAIGTTAAVGTVVGPNPRGTVETGRRHIAAAPHGWGRGFEAYINAAIAAIEAHTVPT